MNFGNHSLRRLIRLGLLGLGAGMMLAAQPGQAAYEWGGGMEYFTVNVSAYDRDQRWVQTVLQTTLAVTRVRIYEDAWWVEASGGWSDWNASGEWQGTGIRTTSYDPFLWVEQKKYQLDFAWQVLDAWGLGFRLAQHELRHHTGDLLNLTYVHYSMRRADVTLNYTPLQTKDVALIVTAGYAPRIWMDADQDTHMTNPETSILPPYRIEQGEGNGWSGQMRMAYRDSMGWGLDLIYRWQSTRFTNLEELSKWKTSSGTLTGYLCLCF